MAAAERCLNGEKQAVNSGDTSVQSVAKDHEKTMLHREANPGTVAVVNSCRQGHVARVIKHRLELHSFIG